MIDYRIHDDEIKLFNLRVFVTVAIICLLAYGFISHDHKIGAIGVFLIYGLIFVAYIWIKHALLIGHLQGNAIRISEQQFPDINQLVLKHCEMLGIDNPPAVFITQQGGILNAFATRLSGRDYVVIYAEVLEMAYQKGLDAVSFIIAHELGHVKRQHVLKNLFLMPSALIPFLAPAYFRACEYTCDNVGFALSPTGYRDGLIILGVGKNLYHRINLKSFIEQIESEKGFWVSFSEALSSHPNLPKRIKSLIELTETSEVKPAVQEITPL